MELEYDCKPTKIKYSDKGYSCRGFIPRFPSRLKELIVNEHDATIEERLARRVYEMGKSGLCPCGSGKQTADCCKNLNCDSIVGNLFAKFSLIDEKIKSETKRQGVHCICKEGCNACCHEYFYISLIEYYAIRFELLKQGKLEAAFREADRQYELLKSQHKNEYSKLNNATLGAALERSFTDNEYISKFELCPCNFNGECSAYSARPFICRAFGTTNQYDTCEKIYHKIKYPLIEKINNSKAKKHIIMLKFDLDFVQRDMDVFYHNNQTRILRPYPLIYWLCHDKEYTHLYDIAINDTKEAFCKKAFK